MTGIDRIILNKVRIKNFEELNKKSVLTTSKTSEYFECRDEICELKQSYHLDTKGNEYFVSSLDFNPNKLLRGDNLNNSSIRDLIKALDIVISKLKGKGIDIDISEACIKYLEINKNIQLSFDTLQEVFLVIGRANFKKAFGHHSFTEEDIPALIKKDRSLYINLRDIAYNAERPEDSAILIAYDKTFETKVKHNINLEVGITRVELKMGRDYYRQELQKKNKDNSLNTLIQNYEIIDKIFKTNVKKFFLDKTTEYIKKTLKPNLRHDFIAFKRTEAAKRKGRSEYVSKGKKIPTHLKEYRGVYRYLKETSWIFDIAFLADVIENNTDPKSRNRELRKVRTKYKDINNYEKLTIFSEKLLKIYLPH